MTMATPNPGAWSPPAPEELPEVRSRLRDQTRSKLVVDGVAGSIDSGRTTLLPRLVGTERHYSPGTVAAPIMCRLERERLASAELYYATADMTSLALAAAQSPSKERLSPDRLPSESGFLLFAEPIGGYSQRVIDALGDDSVADPALTVTTPIVAASWSHWSPQEFTVPEVGPVHWYAHSPRGWGRIADDFQGVWITFYACPADPFSEIAPDEPVSTAPDGRVLTAGDLAAFDQHTLAASTLQWDNEMVAGWGSDMSQPPTPDSTEEWCYVLYTAWQLITQAGNTALTDTEDVPRYRSGRRRDQRDGVTGSSTVRILRVHNRYRPSQQAQEDDTAQSSGRRAPQWGCRWPVRPHRRSVCQNPHGHADGDCTHIDRIIPPHIKGPADKPLRARDTVHLWDTAPSVDDAGDTSPSEPN